MTVPEARPGVNNPRGPATVLAGGGEMGALMRALDWSATAVGPVEDWPQSLKTAVSMLLESRFPMYIAWGRDYTQFYNDAYRPILGATKHPAALGRSSRETFAEVWEQYVGPLFGRVMDHAEPTYIDDWMLPLDRFGFVEECYFTFCYSAIRNETGDVGGGLHGASGMASKAARARGPPPTPSIQISYGPPRPAPARGAASWCATTSAPGKDRTWRFIR